MAPLLNKLKALDAYPKINDDFFRKTMSGGVITLASSIIMVVLFLSELQLYLTPNTRHELRVDSSRGETIDIKFDITFPSMPCAWLSLDAMDISGEYQFDVDHEIYKTRLGSDGKVIQEGQRHTMMVEVKEEKREQHHDEEKCGSCYGAEDHKTKCCNNCDEVREAYRRKGWAFSNPHIIEQCQAENHEQEIKDQEGEGCRMWGSLKVNKVAGNFHFAPGRSHQQGNLHVHDLQPFLDKQLDFTHVVHQLTFGTTYPGMKNPLDGAVVHQKGRGAHHDETGMFQYFLKVVPTFFTNLRNRTLHTNQYSLTEHFHPFPRATDRNLPGVFFFYDLSPIKVHITQYRYSFIHFITSVCAIIGGVFTVSGIIDGLVYHGHKVIKKKIELGKFN